MISTQTRTNTHTYTQTTGEHGWQLLTALLRMLMYLWKGRGRSGQAYITHSNTASMSGHCIFSLYNINGLTLMHALSLRIARWFILSSDAGDHLIKNNQTTRIDMPVLSGSMHSRLRARLKQTIPKLFAAYVCALRKVHSNCVAFNA